MSKLFNNETLAEQVFKKKKRQFTAHASKILFNVTSYLGTQDIFSATLIQTCNSIIPTESH
jgi:hypothetical protein